MKKLLFIFGLLALTAHAETVDIGGTQINLPSPGELVKVTPDINEIFEFLEEVNNIQFPNAWVIASYISLQDLQENKDYVRLCRINIVKDGINGSVPRHIFNQVKSTLKTLTDESSSFSQTILKHVNKTEKNIKEHIYNENSMSEIALKTNIYKETDDSIILLGKVMEEANNNDIKQYVVYNAIATIYVKNKVLNLDCKSSEDQSHWLESTITTWAEQIQNQNPSSIWDKTYSQIKELGIVNIWLILVVAVIGIVLNSIIRNVFIRTN